MSPNRPSMHSMALGALWLGVAALSPRAQAQSCDEPLTVHSSYPADGATDVPTNAPLYLYGPELEEDNVTITLADASGEAVSIDLQPAEGGLLVDPFLGLDPSTRYQLTVAPASGGSAWSAAFTTGTGPAPLVQLRAPDVTVSVIDQDRGSCGVRSAICVNGTVPARRTLEVVVGDEVMSLGDGEPPPTFLGSGARLAANGCVEVRVRAPGGAVSEATRRCGAELGRFDLAANAAAPTSCLPYQNAPAADGDAEPSSDSGGCALRGAAPGASGLWLGLAALLGASWRRRSRSSR